MKEYFIARDAVFALGLSEDRLNQAVEAVVLDEVRKVFSPERVEKEVVALREKIASEVARYVLLAMRS